MNDRKRHEPLEFFLRKALKEEKVRFSAQGSHRQFPEEMLSILLYIKGEDEDQREGMGRFVALLKRDAALFENPSPSAGEDLFFPIRAIAPAAGLLAEEIVFQQKELREKLTAFIYRLKAILCEKIASSRAPLSRQLKLRADLALSIPCRGMEQLSSEEGSNHFGVTIDDLFHPHLAPDLFPFLFMDSIRGKVSLSAETASALRSIWHGKEGFFSAPPLCSFHEGSLPVPTHSDFWMSCLSGILPQRLTWVSLPLQCALLPRENPIFTDPGPAPQKFPSIAEGIIRKNFSLFAFPDSSARLEPYWRGFHLVRGFFLNEEEVVSFSLQGRLAASSHIRKETSSIEVYFTYSEEVQGETDPAALIGFYIARGTGVECSVGGRRSTAFQLGEQVVFRGFFGEVHVVFEQKEGEASVFGQLTAAARPASEERAAGSDWAAFLRPVKVAGNSSFLMRISLYPGLKA